MSNIKWYTIEQLQYTGRVSFPVVFQTKDEQIEGWCIFNWDKQQLQFVQEVNKKWKFFKSEDISKWRYYGSNIPLS